MNYYIIHIPEHPSFLTSLNGTLIAVFECTKSEFIKWKYYKVYFKVKYENHMKITDLFIDKECKIPLKIHR